MPMPPMPRRCPRASAMAKGFLHVALVLAFLDAGAFVEEFFALGDAEEDFDVAAAEVHLQGNQRAPLLLLQALLQPADLAAVQEQAAGAGG